MYFFIDKHVTYLMEATTSSFLQFNENERLVHMQKGIVMDGFVLYQNYYNSESSALGNVWFID